MDGDFLVTIPIPGDRYELMSGTIDYLKNGDLFVSLAEAVRTDKGVDRIRLLKGDAIDGYELERLIDIPTFEERKSS